MRLPGRTVLAALAGTLAAGCGVYEWPARTVVVPPRHFFVHEEALVSLSSDADADATGVCAAPVTSLRLDASCRDACGPIQVSRNGEALATLLAVEMRRASSVDPKRVERPYASAPVDASRTAIVLPSTADRETTYVVEARCGLVARTSGTTAPTVRQEASRLTITASPTCGSTVEIACK